MAFTIRDIGILFGYEVDKSTESNVESSIKSLKETATKLLGGVAVVVAVKKAAQFVQDCVTIASEVEEMENKFDVVFDSLGKQVDQWAQDYADAIGRNKNTIKGYLADQQNLLVGFGMTREAGAELSKQMTTLALDLASFANMDEDTAVNAMTKAVMGQSEAAKTLGAVLNDDTRAQAMLAMGLSGTYESLDQLTKMQVNYQAILSQSPDAIGDCERSLGSYESTTRQFQAKLLEVKQLIGQFFMPTFQKVLSYGTRGLTVLRNIIQKISDFSAKVGGAEKIIKVLGIALAATFAITNAAKIAKMVEQVGNLAKKFGSAHSKALLVFAIILLLVLIVQDFIAFMKGDNSLIGSLFDKAGIGADNARQTILNAWETIKGFLLKAWGVIKGAAETIFGALSAWWAENGEAVKASFEKIWGAIKTLCETLWKALSGAAKTIFGALKAFWDQWVGTILSVFETIWNTLISLIQPFLNALAALIDFLANVFTGNWQGAWQAVKDFAAAIWQMLVNIITGAWDVITTIWSAVVDFFSGIFQNVWDAIVEKVTGIKDSIVNGFQAAIDWIKSLPEQAIQWGADIIDGIVSGIKSAVGKIGDAVSGVASTIKSFLGFSEPEDGPLSDFHTYMPDMMDLMTQGITAGKEKVKAALEVVTGDMSVIAKSNVVSPGTARTASTGGNTSRTVTQNVEINNQFNGDRAGQEKSAEAMDKAADDSTAQMARALAFGR